MYWLKSTQFNVSSPILMIHIESYYMSCKKIRWPSFAELALDIAPWQINGITPPKLQALARRDTPTLTQ